MSKPIRLQDLKGKLIVSCQAFPGDALYGSEMMSKMAIAAKDGGAAGIRANSPEDIAAIRRAVDLPIIGLWKKEYERSDVYITPTLADAQAVVEAGASIVAMDSTSRMRPGGERLEDVVRQLKSSCSCLLMADVSTFEEGMDACRIGFDLVSTTLSGYTPYSLQSDAPDFELVEKLARSIPIPVFAEGRIQTQEEAARMLECGAYAVVIGGAITRPQMITRKFVNKISGMTGKETGTDMK